jgi:hypothetical protein
MSLARKEGNALSYAEIREKYSVPARRGALVIANGIPGTVSRARNYFVWVRFQGNAISKPFRPDEIRWVSDSVLNPEKASACNTELFEPLLSTA